MNIILTVGETGMSDDILSALFRSEDIELTVVDGGDSNINLPSDISSKSHDEVPGLLEKRSHDILIDCSNPAAATKFVSCAAKHDVPVITGTSGFDDNQLSTIHDATKQIPVLFLRNLSVGQATFAQALEEIVCTIPDFDLELTETRNSEHLQSPSETAEKVLDIIEEIRGETLTVHGRLGTHPRAEARGNNEIGVHSRRVGEGYDTLEVLFGGNGERVSLKYELENPNSFADALIDTATWLAQQKPDLYDVTDLH